MIGAPPQTLMQFLEQIGLLEIKSGYQCTRLKPSVTSL